MIQFLYKASDFFIKQISSINNRLSLIKIYTFVQINFIMKHIFSVLIFAMIFLQHPLHGQNVGQGNDSLINYEDINGVKQGHWKKNYPNGKIAYEGYFKDGKPVGLMKRYFEEGGLSTELNYDKEGYKCKAKLFHSNSKLAATGNYYDKKKDSIWSYYSDSERLIAVESYLMGMKNGKFLKYHENGKVAEEVNYENDQKQGLWRIYYPDGSSKMETMFLNNKRNGLFYSYYDNGRVEIKGLYVNDLRDKEWIYYKPDGKLDFKLEYIYGKANMDELDRREKKKFEEYEKNRKILKNPQDYINNFEEYFKSN